MTSPRRSAAGGTQPEGELLTFLIADIRGYTAFTQERGDEAAARLAARFAEIARESVEARGGSVIELRGDEALAVFGSARQALRAAVELQLTFIDETERHPDLPLTVGCGLDAGEAVPVEGGYRGGALNLAARLCSQAGPAETLASQAVAHLARAVEGVRVTDPRVLHVKGLAEPVTALQVLPTGAEPGELAERLDAAVRRPPQAKTRRELPPELSAVDPVSGRDRELRRLRWAWRQSRQGRGRAVALIGAAGAGKTRLLAEAAAAAAEDSAPVAFARGTDAPALAAAIAQARAAAGPMLVAIDDRDAADDVTSPFQELAAILDTRPILAVVTLTDDPSRRTLDAAVARLARSDGLIRLGPLDATAVREIGALYLGERAAALPVESILERSGGLPGTVHRAVSEWAQADARRKLGEAAGRATAGRRNARRQEAELADNVINLQRVRDRVRRYGPLEEGEAAESVARDEPPYKGLSTFQPDDAELFFGREQLIAELVARLAGSPFLAVVGPSGSGKSSAVRAGLLPALRAGVLPGFEPRIVAVMRPGEHPLRELDRAVWGALPEDLRARLAGEELPLRAAQRLLPEGERLLLVVDQLEEAFTVAADADESARFVEALTEAATDPDARAAVVVTIRADFYGHAAASPALAELLGENHVLVGPMSADEYRRAIEEPARVAGADVDPALTDALVGEVLGQPGALPLLSSALLELWQLRTGRTIPFEAYAQTGGVRGAVARLAEAAYLGLTEEQQRVARSVMLRLAGPGEGTTVVKRRVPLSEFDAPRNPDVARVLDVLTQGRLVTVSEGSVEVAHEALLREWPRLQGWLEEDRSGRRLHQHLIGAAAEWNAAGRDVGELYRGARLTSALDWTTEHNLELNELEREFLANSRAASERDAERQRRTNRRLRLLLAGAGVFLVVAVAAGAVALLQREAAEQAATEATAQRLGAQALVENDLDLSMLLARQGVAFHDSPVTRGNLLSALVRSPAAIAIERPLPGRLLTVFANPSGSEVLVSNNSGQTAVFDPLSAVEPRTFQSGFGFFAADGRIVFDAGGGSFNVADAASGTPQHLVTLPPSFGGFFLTSDLERLAVTAADGSALTIHDVETGEPIRELAPPEGSAFLDVYWFPDDEHMLTIDHIGPLPDEIGPAFGEPIFYSWWEPGADAPTARVEEDEAWGLALAPDSHSVAIRRQDGRVYLHDFTTGESRDFNGRHNASVQGAGFSPDGRTLVTTGDDRVAIVWDVESGQARETLRGHNGRVFGPAFSPDGETVFTVSLDGSLMAWDLGGGRRLDRRFDLGPTSFREDPRTPDLSGDGRFYAYPLSGGAVTVRDGRTIEEITRLDVAQDKEVVEAAFSPDGSLLATGGSSGSVVLWAVEDWARLRELEGPSDREWIVELEFSPDGATIAAGAAVPGEFPGEYSDGAIYLWDAASGDARPAPPDPAAPILDIAFAPDGSMIGAGLETGGAAHAVVWRTGNMSELYRVVMADFVARGIDFSPDGELLATGGGEGQVRFWDAASGEPRGREVRASSGFVISLDFDPSGDLLLSTGTDGTVRLIDVATRSQVGAPLPGMDNDWVVAEFGPDGSQVYGVYPSGGAFVWDVDPERWASHACDVAGRQLTEDEWQRFLPDRPYEPACGGG